MTQSSNHNSQFGLIAVTLFAFVLIVILGAAIGSIVGDRDESTVSAPATASPSATAPAAAPPQATPPQPGATP